MKAIRLTIAAVLLSTAAWAGPGDVDPSFGTGGSIDLGVLVAHFEPVPPSSATPAFVTVEQSGEDTVIRKFAPDGSVDTSFGPGGATTISQMQTGQSVARMRLDANGNIVVVGRRTQVSPGQIVVARLDPSGLPDVSFGTGGVVTTNVTGSLNDIGSTLAFQAGGKIVVAGSSDPLGGTRTTDIRGALVRYLNDGSVDTSFGTGGQVLLAHSFAVSLAVQSDDKIVVGSTRGRVPPAEPGFDFVVTRLTSSGSLDATFGSGGEVTVPFMPGPVEDPITQSVEGDDAETVLVQSDGKIVAVGLGVSLIDFAGVVRRKVMVARYLANGSFDPAWGGGNVVLLVGILPSALLESGDTVVVGTGADGAFPSTPGIVARLRTDGVREPGFGTCGVANGVDHVGDVALEGDGKVLILSGSKIYRIESGAADVSGQPDGDGDSIPDACDVCPVVSNPAQVDRDGDGLGDECDPCTDLGGRLPRKGANLIVNKLGAPSGDETLSLAGTVLIPTSPAVDPVSTGIRFLLGDFEVADNGLEHIRYDVTIPGGAYNPATKTGWKPNKTITAWKYSNPAGVQGITSVGITLVTKPAGRVKVSVKGKKLMLPTDYPPPAGNPIAYVQLRPGSPLQCGSWTLMGCVSNSMLTKVSCKKGF